MKSRGYLWILLMFSASLSKSLLRLFGETLSFETPASTQATICPLLVTRQPSPRNGA